MVIALHDKCTTQLCSLRTNKRRALLHADALCRPPHHCCMSWSSAVLKSTATPCMKSRTPSSACAKPTSRTCTRPATPIARASQGVQTMRRMTMLAEQMNVARELHTCSTSAMKNVPLVITIMQGNDCRICHSFHPRSIFVTDKYAM